MSDGANALNALLQRRDEQFTRSVTAWADGVRSELRFWRKHLGLVARGRNPEYVQRLAPDRPVIAELAPLISGPNCCILDVGAGAITACGTTMAGKVISVVPIDPLASFYDQIRREFGIGTTVPTQFGFAEDLSAQFTEESFDIAFSINALDHAIDPIGAIVEMLVVLKTGGTIFIGSKPNEAEVECYHGMHQWNFCDQNGDFVIWNREVRHNMTHVLSSCASVRTESRDGMLHVYIRKLLSPVSDLAAFHRSRRALYLPAVLRFMVENQLPPPLEGRMCAERR